MSSSAAPTRGPRCASPASPPGDGWGERRGRLQKREREREKKDDDRYKSRDVHPPIIQAEVSPLVSH